MKKLFLLSFSLLFINVASANVCKKIEKDSLVKFLDWKFNSLEEMSSDSLNEEDSIVDDWKVAEASYYYPSRMNNGYGGYGATGRRIKTGSIAVGSHFFKENFIKKGNIVYIQIKDSDVITPYGKGVFRVDDLMGPRYNNRRKKDNFFIDFFYKDVNREHRKAGRFNVMFRIYKILNIPGAI